MQLVFGNVSEMLSHVFNLLAAYALSLPIGWDREKEERSAGVRTFPLVALASWGFVLIGMAVMGKGSPSQARILEGPYHRRRFHRRRRHPEAGGLGFRYGHGCRSLGNGRRRRCRRLWSLRHCHSLEHNHLSYAPLLAASQTKLSARRACPAGFRDRSEEARQWLFYQQTSIDHAIRKNASVAKIISARIAR